MAMTRLPAFTQYFQVLRYDTRGDGKSSVSDGPYSIEQLSGDVMARLDKLNITKASFCGRPAASG